LQAQRSLLTGPQGERSGRCVPPWLFHYLDQRDYPRAIVMALAGIICIGVTIAGSLGGLAKSADEGWGNAARRSPRPKITEPNWNA
jgi:hypothetical protein